MAVFSTSVLGCGAECGVGANLVSTDSAVSCQCGGDEFHRTSDGCRWGERWGSGRSLLSEFLSQLSWFLTLL